MITRMNRGTIEVDRGTSMGFAVPLKTSPNTKKKQQQALADSKRTIASEVTSEIVGIM